VLQIILNYAGIAVFASSGATVGVRKGFDLFGIATLGVLTGVGGGVLRDVLLDIVPPQSVQHWPNITVALIAVAIATPLARLAMRMNTAVLVLDAIGMGFSPRPAQRSRPTPAPAGSRRASSACSPRSPGE